MSNIPENEKINNTENSGGDEVFSTVFSDPTEHKRTAPEKKKNKLLIAIASILAVAIFAGGTVAVIKLIPEREEEEITSPYAEEIEVKAIESDSLSSVTVTNSEGTVKLYSVAEKAEGSDTETVNWYVDGVDTALTSTSTANQFVSAVGNIKAMREITKKTAEDCGLNSPSATAVLTPKEGDALTITMGAISPDNSGYYCSVSDSEKIYLVDSSYMEEFKVNALSFASTSAMSAFAVPDGASDYLSDDGTIVTFDKLTVKSSKFPETLHFASNTDEELSQYMGYVVTSPSERIAQNVEYVVEVFKSGVQVSGAYSYDVSQSSIKAFGLDAPDFEATLDIMGKTMTYKFKLQEDGEYAAVCDDSKLISKVAPSSLASFIDLGLTDYYSSWVCLYNISDLSSLNIKVNDKAYNFGITANEDEEAEDKYIITLNGEKIDCQSFQNFYQYCVSLSCTDFKIENLTASPEITLDFAFNNGTTPNSLVEFTKASDTRYQYSIGGIDMGKTTAASMNKFVKYLEKLAAGEKIGSVS